MSERGQRVERRIVYLYLSNLCVSEKELYICNSYTYVFEYLAREIWRGRRRQEIEGIEANFICIFYFFGLPTRCSEPH